MKIIKIEKCSQCPNNDHKGGFGNPSYVPVCRLVKREQPWEPTLGFGNKIVAHQTVDIPDWCPLENYAPAGG